MDFIAHKDFIHDNGREDTLEYVLRLSGEDTVLLNGVVLVYPENDAPYQHKTLATAFTEMSEEYDEIRACRGSFSRFYSDLLEDALDQLESTKQEDLWTT